MVYVFRMLLGLAGQCGYYVHRVWIIAVTAGVSM